MKTFESLYRDYYQKVYAFLNRMCADGDLAEDLTQETFLQAYKSLYKFRGECEVFTWLAAIGKHTYFKYLKKKRLHLDAANLDLVAQSYLKGDVSPEEHVSQKDIEKAVRKVVEDIPKNTAMWWCCVFMRSCRFRRLHRYSGLAKILQR